LNVPWPEHFNLQTFTPSHRKHPKDNEQQYRPRKRTQSQPQQQPFMGAQRRVTAAAERQCQHREEKPVRPSTELPGRRHDRRRTTPSADPTCSVVVTLLLATCKID